MSKSPAERIQSVIDALAAAQLVLSSPSKTDNGPTCAKLLADILGEQRLQLAVLRDELASSMPALRKTVKYDALEILAEILIMQSMLRPKMTEVWELFCKTLANS